MRLQTEAVVAAIRHDPRARDLDWSRPKKAKKVLVSILRDGLPGWISKDEAEEYADRVIATHRIGHLAIA